MRRERNSGIPGDDEARREAGARRFHMLVLTVAAAALLLVSAVWSLGDDDVAAADTGDAVEAAQAAEVAVGGQVGVASVHQAAAEAPMSAQQAVGPDTAAQVAVAEVVRVDPPAPEPLAEYVVQPGDFLGRIAEARGCTVAALMVANNLHHDRILVGQKLRLPTACGGLEDIPAAERAPHYRERGVDQKVLPELMKARGFRPPERFKALVIEVTFDPMRRTIVSERGFDWHGTSVDATNWNPASSIKLFPAIAALQRLEAHGFTSKSTVTFEGSKRHQTNVADLVRLAIIDSDNIAYNRLVQLAGFDYLHEQFLTEDNGFQSAALTRAYQQSTWAGELGEDISLRHAPDITIVEGEREHTFPGGRGEASTGCGNAACSSLQDLAEATRRLMLQEQLPAEAGFGLSMDDLIMLRQAMRAERARGNEMVDAFADVFDDDRVRFYSKPGFSKGWYSDNVYIYDPTANQAWIVAMAGFEGRDSLDEAAEIVADIIASGDLRATAAH